MSNIVTLVIFLISALCIAHGIYYNLIVSIVVGIVGACYAVFKYNTHKEQELKKNFISEEELKSELVRIEQETVQEAPPIAAPEVPVVSEEKKVLQKPAAKVVKAKPPTPVIKAANSEKAPPKKRGRKPTKK